jgi:hypothetical protein
MPMLIIEFTTDKRFVRRARALKTIETMVHMYCSGHRHEGRAPLCSDCGALFEYAARRLQRCVFGNAKPTCANCVVHCYKADMREQMRVVMRRASPRMMLRHPIMGIAHLINKRRPVPTLPAKPANSRSGTQDTANSAGAKCRAETGRTVRSTYAEPTSGVQRRYRTTQRLFIMPLSA